MRFHQSNWKRTRWSLLLLPALLLVPDPTSALETAEEVQEIFNSFYRTELNTDTVYAADGVRLRKDAMTFEFLEGDIFLMEPVNGEITGAFFVGQGPFQMFRQAVGANFWPVQHVHLAIAAALQAWPVTGRLAPGPVESSGLCLVRCHGLLIPSWSTSTTSMPRRPD